MRLLIIPDLHGRKFWRQTIADNISKVDKVIFLGDYLDPYPQEIRNNPDSMECNSFDDAGGLLYMLNDIISLKRNEPDKYILLTGNHTDSYIWSKFVSASRTDYDHWELYHKIFSENLNLFNLVFIQDNVIFSHAGFVDGWAKRMWKKFKYPESQYKSIIDTALALNDIPLKDFVKNDIVEYLGELSRYRNGYYLYGSCEWADIYEHIDLNKSREMNIVPRGEDGIYQVFGHTQLKQPVITDKWACLDCRKGFIIDTLTHKIEEI